VVVLALMLLAAPSANQATAIPAPAPDEHKDHAHDKAAAKKDAHDDHHDKAKPPNLFEPALDLGIWTLLVFFLLLFVLKKWAWGPILEGLRKREEHIKLAVEEAKLARAETEKVRLEFKAEMAKAYAAIPKIMEDARRDAANLREEIRAKAASEIQADRDRLRREIDTAKNQALADLFSQAANLATMISQAAIGRSLTEEDHRRLNEETLRQVEAASDDAKHSLRQFGEEWTRKGGGSE
jgi:F-type H+-transporting ATPase subunit b